MPRSSPLSASRSSPSARERSCAAQRLCSSAASRTSASFATSSPASLRSATSRASSAKSGSYAVRVAALSRRTTRSSSAGCARLSKSSRNAGCPSPAPAAGPRSSGSRCTSSRGASSASPSRRWRMAGACRLGRREERSFFPLQRTNLFKVPGTPPVVLSDRKVEGGFWGVESMAYKTFETDNAEYVLVYANPAQQHIKHVDCLEEAGLKDLDAVVLELMAEPKAEIFQAQSNPLTAGGKPGASSPYELILNRIHHLYEEGESAPTVIVGDREVGPMEKMIYGMSGSI